MTPVRIVTLALSLFLATGLGACDISIAALNAVEGNGVELRQERNVDDFREVRLLGTGDLLVTSGVDTAVAITCDENLVPLIRTEVDGDVLKIFPEEPIAPEVDLVIEVGTPSIRSVSCAGAGSMEVRGIDEDDFNAGLSGAGKVELYGRADRLEVDVSGVGSVEAEELVAREAIVRVSGVGKAHVNGTERVDARVSGVGKVTYLGNPEVEERVSGLGQISKRD